MNNFEYTYKEFRALSSLLETVDSRTQEARGIRQKKGELLQGKTPVFKAILSDYTTFVALGENEILNITDIPIDFSQEFVQCLKENGVKEFTVSSHSTMALDEAMQLVKSGAQLMGMTEIDFYDEKRTALVFKIA